MAVYLKDDPQVRPAEPGSPEEAALKKTYTTTDKNAPAGIYACLNCGKEQVLERDSGHPAPCQGTKTFRILRKPFTEDCLGTEFELRVMVEN